MRRWVEIGACVSPVKNWNPVREGNGTLITYIDISSVRQSEKVIDVKPPILAKDAPSRARQLVSAGDVLVSTVRPNLNAVARVPESLDGATASTGFCVLRADNEVLISEYLFHWVKSPQFIAEMVKRATGASYPAVSDRIVLQSKLPVPTLQEQRRIARILDKADEFRAKRRAVLGQIDELLQAIFVEFFSKDGRFETVELQDLCELITDGTHYTPEYCEHGVVFLSAKNVKSGSVDWEDVKFISESLHQELRKRVSPKRNDILLAKNGTTGIAAIVDKDCIFDIYVSLALLRPAPDVLPVYLHAALNSPVCQRQFEGALKGIGVPNLHLVDIKRTRVPHAPAALQA